MKKIKILTDENKRLLAYCDFGELENGIEIEVEDDFEFKHFLADYIFENNQIVYKPSLEELKKIKREELKKIRDSKIHENIEVHGSLFQVREQDTMKFQLIGLGLALGKLNPMDKEKWVLADNTVKDLTNIELVNVLIEKEARERELFAKFIELDSRLQLSKTIEEIEAIKWE